MTPQVSKPKYRSLKESYQKEKSAVDAFLFSGVSTQLLEILKKLFVDVVNWGKNIKEASGASSKQQQILKNIAILKKQLPDLKTINYWQLLQVLLRFPGNFQIALYDEIIEFMKQNESFNSLPQKINVKEYRDRSLRAFLTDCLALSKLREEQLKALHEENIHKSIEIEKHFAIIPNHFLLIEKIKQEGMITVYRGINIETNQVIIIRYLSHEKDEKSLNENEKLEYKRFSREAKSFEQLQKYRSKKIHAGQKQIDKYFIKAYRLARGKKYQFCFERSEFKRSAESKGIEFMVMRYIEGVGLDELLKEYREKNISISIKIIMYILDSLLQALDYCNRERITHRDICPQNIYITKQFEVRLTNLGWAGLDMNQVLPQWSFIGSSPHYTAPEGVFQQQENIKEVVSRTDCRFDLYSVGCLAYEMLVGHVPFVSSKENQQEHEKEILKKHLFEQPISPKNTRSEVSEKLSDVIMKLLSKDPDDRYQNPQEALQDLHKSFSLSQKASVVSQKVMTKTPKETQEFNIRDLPIENKKKRSFFKVAIIFLLVLSPVAYHFRLEIKDFVQLQYAKYEDYIAYKNLQEDLARFIEKVSYRINRCDIVIQTLQNKYPAAKGYPHVDGRIVNIVHGQKKYLSELKSIVAEGTQQYAKGFDHISIWTKKYQNHIQKGQSVPEILDRAFDKLSAIQRIAISLKENRDQEKMMRKTYRLLRDHLIKTEEWVLTIEQNLKTLEDQYPVKKGYLPVDEYIHKNLKKAKETMVEYEDAITKITNQIQENQFAEAISLAKPYQYLASKELDYLLDTNETVQQILSSCENIYRERQQRIALDQTFVMLQNRQIELQNTFEETKSKWQEVQKMSISNLSPEQIFTEVEKEITELSNLTTTVNKLLDQVKEDEAILLLEPYTQGKKTSLNDLKSLQEQFINSIQIAMAPKRPEVNKEDIINLLSLAKSHLSQIEQTSVFVDKNLQYLEEEFDKEKALTKEQMDFLEKTKKYQSALVTVVKKAEENVSEDRLLDALTTLKDKEQMIQIGVKFVDNLKKISAKMEEQTVYLQKEKKRKRWLDECSYIMSRIKTQKERLEQVMLPIEKQVTRLTQLYPREKGYSQIEDELLYALAESKKTLTFYQDNLQQANELLKKDRVLEALNLVKKEQQFGSTINLQNKLKRLEERSIEIDEIVKVEKFEKEKEWQMQQLIAKLESRKLEIDQLIPGILGNLDQLSKYSESNGYIQVDVKTRKYVNDARGESEELGEIISEARDLFLQKQYDSMQSLVDPYVDNPPFSMLPLLKTYMENSTTALTKNRELENNPQLRTERQKKFALESSKQTNLQKWRRSPGQWYGDLSTYLGKYQQYPLLNFLKDKGSLLIHSRIEIGIKKIEEYPDMIAELEGIIFDIQGQGKTIPKDPHNTKLRMLNDYILSKAIQVDINEEKRVIESSIYKLQQEINNSWIEEETLRNILRNIDSVVRKFNDSYIPIKSALINIQYE